MTISLKTKAAGNANLDLVFDPYVQGTYVADTGLLADASLGGGDIARRYAPLVYGSPAAATGLLTKQTGNADINTLFAAYGTAIYSLPINGQIYTNSKLRGTASLSMFTYPDGTYAVIKDYGQGSQATLASGTWLPAGDTVSQYTVQYIESGASNGPDPGGGNNTFSNNAPTPKPCTTTQQFYLSSSANTGQTASNDCTLEIDLFKNGSLRFKTTISLNCSVG